MEPTNASRSLGWIWRLAKFRPCFESSEANDCSLHPMTRFHIPFLVSAGEAEGLTQTHASYRLQPYRRHCCIIYGKDFPHMFQSSISHDHSLVELHILRAEMRENKFHLTLDYGSIRVWRVRRYRTPAVRSAGSALEIISHYSFDRCSNVVVRPWIM